MNTFEKALLWKAGREAVNRDVNGEKIEATGPLKVVDEVADGYIEGTIVGYVSCIPAFFITLVYAFLTGFPKRLEIDSLGVFFISALICQYFISKAYSKKIK